MVDPKSKGKKPSVRKRTKSTGPPGNHESRPKKRKPNGTFKRSDGIAKSKQLSQKLQNKRATGSRSRTSNKNDEPRICGNGKPMPSLDELERMFEDSDTDEEVNSKLPESVSKSICTTPIKKPCLSEDKLKSPNTIKEIANKMLDFITNHPDPSELLVGIDTSPPPVIPQKKHKKSDIPYIVGCKDRPQRISKPTANFCKGDEDYGIDENITLSDDDESCSKKRAKRSKQPNISKSIFNAKTDEIAARLKEINGNETDSSDSNKTVAYEYYTPINSSTLRSFSPLPSTSRDNETILKNEQRFNKSLRESSLLDIQDSDHDSDILSNNIIKNEQCDNISEPKDMQNDVEIIEQPCETIIIDDQISVNESHKIQNDLIEIDDSCVEVVETPTRRVMGNASPISVEDYYSSLDVNQTYDDDICEVIDVDDVIAENKAIIEKYRKSNDINKVTDVDSTENKSIVNSRPKPNTEVIADTAHNLLPMTVPEPISSHSSSTNHCNEHRSPSKSRIEREVTGFFSNTERNNSPPKSNLVCPSMRDILFSWMLGLKFTHNDTPKKRKKKNTVTPLKPPPPPPEEVESPRNPKTLGDCPICMDSLSKNTVASTMCGHVFCLKCIEAAIRSSGKRCPTCRKVLKGTGYHKIFL